MLGLFFGLVVLAISKAPVPERYTWWYALLVGAATLATAALTWFASRQLGNSEAMTVGCATLAPGGMSPRHYHPNCEEILHVLHGTILHTMGGEKAAMGPGCPLLPGAVEAPAAVL